MSINAKEKIKCPQCGELSEVTVWQSITVSDSKDLKDDLLKGKINIFRCSSCGRAALLPNPLLYHDEEKRLMISFSPCSDDSAKYRLFDNIRRSSHESGELTKLEDYDLRFVTAYNDFLEKILIFDADLHDKVIELIKLAVLMQDSEHMQNRVCMFGKRDGEELEFMVQDKAEEKIYTSRVPMQTYETIKEHLKMSGIKYKSFDWEIVDSDYATKMLYGMNNNL